MTIREVAIAGGTAVGGSLLALAVCFAITPSSPIDAALPLWVALAACCSIVIAEHRPPIAAGESPAAGRGSGILPFAIPLLLAASIGIADPRTRHLAYGIVLALAFALTAAILCERGRMPLGRSGALLALLLTARLVPLSAESSAGVALIAAGSLFLLHLSSESEAFGERTDAEPIGGAARRVPLTAFLLIAALAMVAPAEPWRGALFPLAAGAVAAALGQGSLLMVGLALIAGAVVGQWALAASCLAVASLIGARWIEARGHSRIAIPPLMAGSASGLVAVLSFAPGAVAGVLHAPAASRIAAAAILALSLLVRTQPAILLSLLALILLAGGTGLAVRRLAVVAAVFSFGAMALLPWSGALGATFPSLLAPAVRVGLAAGMAISLLLPVRIGAVAVALLFLALFTVAGRGAGHVQRVAVSLAPGKISAISLPADVSRLHLVMSGSNVSGFREGTRLGTIRILDARGNGWSRPFAIGDLADWAAFRPGESLFRTLNRVPAVPGGTLEGWGRDAFLRGEGKILLDSETGIAGIVVELDSLLPPDVRVQIERIEVAGR